MHTGSGLGRKAATLVCKSEKLAFAYFALVSLTSVHKIPKMDGPWNFWKPLTADYVAAGFFSQTNAPHIFGSPTRLTTLLIRKMALPYFWNPWGRLWGWGSVVG